MARQNVRVDVPSNADDALLLFKAVIDKNTADGVDSPIRSLNMQLMQTLYTIALAANAESKRLSGLAEIETRKRDNALGKAQTPDTLNFILAQVRDLLLSIYKLNPKELEQWGFTVIVSESVSRPKTTPKL